MKIDLSLKKGQWIGKVNSLLQEFKTTSPHLLIKLVNTFASSLCGSCLWDILSPECEKLNKSWNVTDRHVFHLDRRTHRNLIEQLSNVCHLKKALLSRFLSFYKQLTSSSKFSVRYLARITGDDQSTVMGRTLHYIGEKCGIDRNEILTLSNRNIKDSIKYCELDDQQVWKVSICQELMSARYNNDSETIIPGFNQYEIQEMLNSICVN